MKPRLPAAIPAYCLTCSTRMEGSLGESAGCQTLCLDQRVLSMKLILAVVLTIVAFVAPKERLHRAVSVFARAPLIFEANEGQTEPDVKFVARGAGYVAFLSADALVLRSANDRSTRAPIRITFA